MQADTEDASAFMSGMARRSQPLLKHLGGIQQAIDIAIEGLLNRELKTSLKKIMRQGKILSFEQCLAHIADLQDSLGFGQLQTNVYAEAPKYTAQPKKQFQRANQYGNRTYAKKEEYADINAIQQESALQHHRMIKTRRKAL